MRREPKSLQAEKFVVDNLYYVDLVPMGPGISDSDPHSGEKGFGECCLVFIICSAPGEKAMIIVNIWHKPLNNAIYINVLYAILNAISTKPS